MGWEHSDKGLAENLRAKLTGDPEIDHPIADKFLCELLKQLDYPELVRTFEQIRKWYS